MYVCIDVCMYWCMYVCVYVCVYVFLCNIYIYIYIYMYTHTHTHTTQHTHLIHRPTPPPPPPPPTLLCATAMTSINISLCLFFQHEEPGNFLRAARLPAPDVRLHRPHLLPGGVSAVRGDVGQGPLQRGQVRSRLRGEQGQVGRLQVRYVRQQQKALADGDALRPRLHGVVSTLHQEAGFKIRG